MDDTKAGDQSFVDRLENRGNCGKLVGLPNQMAKYNGLTSTQFESLAAGRFLVHLPGKDLQIVVRQRNIEVVPDYKEQGRMEMENAKRATRLKKQGGGTNGSNRSNVRLAISSLSSEIRKALREAAKSKGGDAVAGIKSLFAAFDVNSDSQIDKAEFQNGCRDFGVSISTTEVDLIWPIFDLDNSGHVSFTEMLDFMKDRGRKGATQREKQDSEVREIIATKALRRRRIKAKSQYRSVLQDLKRNIKHIIRAHMAKNTMTAGEIFDLFDANKGESIDKGEFMKGLSRISPTQIFGEEPVDLIWPVICGKQGLLQISRQQWSTYIESVIDSASYTLTIDEKMKADSAKNIVSIGKLLVVTGPQKSAGREKTFTLPSINQQSVDPKSKSARISNLPKLKPGSQIKDRRSRANRKNKDTAVRKQLSDKSRRRSSLYRQITQQKKKRESLSLYSGNVLLQAAKRRAD
jgi:Ca2+-binding EF-hand superfamily protein